MPDHSASPTSPPGSANNSGRMCPDPSVSVHRVSAQPSVSGQAAVEEPATASSLHQHQAAGADSFLSGWERSRPSSAVANRTVPSLSAMEGGEPSFPLHAALSPAGLPAASAASPRASARATTATLSANAPRGLPTPHPTGGFHHPGENAGLWLLSPASASLGPNPGTVEERQRFRSPEKEASDRHRGTRVAYVSPPLCPCGSPRVPHTFAHACAAFNTLPMTFSTDQRPTEEPTHGACVPFPVSRRGAGQEANTEGAGVLRNSRSMPLAWGRRERGCAHEVRGGGRGRPDPGLVHSPLLDVLLSRHQDEASFPANQNSSGLSSAGLESNLSSIALAQFAGHMAAQTPCRSASEASGAAQPSSQPLRLSPLWPTNSDEQQRTLAFFQAFGPVKYIFWDLCSCPLLLRGPVASPIARFEKSTPERTRVETDSAVTAGNSLSRPASDSFSSALERTFTPTEVVLMVARFFKADVSAVKLFYEEDPETRPGALTSRDVVSPHSFTVSASQRGGDSAVAGESEGLAPVSPLRSTLDTNRQSSDSPSRPGGRLLDSLVYQGSLPHPESPEAAGRAWKPGEGEEKDSGEGRAERTQVAASALCDRLDRDSRVLLSEMGCLVHECHRRRVMDCVVAELQRALVATRRHSADEIMQMTLHSSLHLGDLEILDSCLSPSATPTIVILSSIHFDFTEALRTEIERSRLGEPPPRVRLLVCHNYDWPFRPTGFLSQFIQKMDVPPQIQSAVYTATYRQLVSAVYDIPVSLLLPFSPLPSLPSNSGDCRHEQWAGGGTEDDSDVPAPLRSPSFPLHSSYTSPSPVRPPPVAPPLRALAARPDDSPWRGPCRQNTFPQENRNAALLSLEFGARKAAQQSSSALLPKSDALSPFCLTHVSAPRSRPPGETVSSGDWVARGQESRAAVPSGETLSPPDDCRRRQFGDTQGGGPAPGRCDAGDARQSDSTWEHRGPADGLPRCEKGEREESPFRATTPPPLGTTTRTASGKEHPCSADDTALHSEQTREGAPVCTERTLDEASPDVGRAAPVCPPSPNPTARGRQRQPVSAEKRARGDEENPHGGVEDAGQGALGGGRVSQKDTRNPSRDLLDFLETVALPHSSQVSQEAAHNNFQLLKRCFASEADRRGPSTAAPHAAFLGDIGAAGAPKESVPLDRRAERPEETAERVEDLPGPLVPSSPLHAQLPGRASESVAGGQRSAGSSQEGETGAPKFSGEERKRPSVLSASPSHSQGLASSPSHEAGESRAAFQVACLAMQGQETTALSAGCSLPALEPRSGKDASGTKGQTQTDATGEEEGELGVPCGSQHRPSSTSVASHLEPPRFAPAVAWRRRTPDRQRCSADPLPPSPVFFHLAERESGEAPRRRETEYFLLDTSGEESASQPSSSDFGLSYAQLRDMRWAREPRDLPSNAVPRTYLLSSPPSVCDVSVSIGSSEKLEFSFEDGDSLSKVTPPMARGWRRTGQQWHQGVRLGIWAEDLGQAEKRDRAEAREDAESRRKTGDDNLQGRREREGAETLESGKDSRRLGEPGERGARGSPRPVPLFSPETQNEGVAFRASPQREEASKEEDASHAPGRLNRETDLREAHASPFQLGEESSSTLPGHVPGCSPQPEQRAAPSVPSSSSVSGSIRTDADTIGRPGPSACGGSDDCLEESAFPPPASPGAAGGRSSEGHFRQAPYAAVSLSSSVPSGAFSVSVSPSFLPSSAGSHPRLETHAGLPRRDAGPGRANAKRRVSRFRGTDGKQPGQAEQVGPNEPEVSGAPPHSPGLSTSIANAGHEPASVTGLAFAIGDAVYASFSPNSRSPDVAAASSVALPSEGLVSFLPLASSSPSSPSSSSSFPSSFFPSSLPAVSQPAGVPPAYAVGAPLSAGLSRPVAVPRLRLSTEVMPSEFEGPGSVPASRLSLETLSLIAASPPPFVSSSSSPRNLHQVAPEHPADTRRGQAPRALAHRRASAADGASPASFSFASFLSLPSGNADRDAASRKTEEEEKASKAEVSPTRRLRRLKTTTEQARREGLRGSVNELAFRHATRRTLCLQGKDGRGVSADGQGRAGGDSFASLPLPKSACVDASSRACRQASFFFAEEKKDDGPDRRLPAENVFFSLWHAVTGETPARERQAALPASSLSRGPPGPAEPRGAKATSAMTGQGGGETKQGKGEKRGEKEESRGEERANEDLTKNENAAAGEDVVLDQSAPDAEHRRGDSLFYPVAISEDRPDMLRSLKREDQRDVCPWRQQTEEALHGREREEEHLGEDAGLSEPPANAVSSFRNPPPETAFLWNPSLGRLSECPSAARRLPPLAPSHGRASGASAELRALLQVDGGVTRGKESAGRADETAEKGEVDEQAVVRDEEEGDSSARAPRALTTETNVAAEMQGKGGVTQVMGTHEDANLKETRGCSERLAEPMRGECTPGGSADHQFLDVPADKQAEEASPAEGKEPFSSAESSSQTALPGGITADGGCRRLPEDGNREALEEAGEERQEARNTWALDGEKEEVLTACMEEPLGGDQGVGTCVPSSLEWSVSKEPHRETFKTFAGRGRKRSDEDEQDVFTARTRVPTKEQERLADFFGVTKLASLPCFYILSTNQNVTLAMVTQFLLRFPEHVKTEHWGKRHVFRSTFRRDEDVDVLFSHSSEGAFIEETPAEFGRVRLIFTRTLPPPMAFVVDDASLDLLSSDEADCPVPPAPSDSRDAASSTLASAQEKGQPSPAPPLSRIASLQPPGRPSSPSPPVSSLAPSVSSVSVRRLASPLPNAEGAVSRSVPHSNGSHPGHSSPPASSLSPSPCSSLGPSPSPSPPLSPTSPFRGCAASTGSTAKRAAASVSPLRARLPPEDLRGREEQRENAHVGRDTGRPGDSLESQRPATPQMSPVLEAREARSATEKPQRKIGRKRTRDDRDSATKAPRAAEKQIEVSLNRPGEADPNSSFFAARQEQIAQERPAYGESIRAGSKPVVSLSLCPGANLETAHSLDAGADEGNRATAFPRRLWVFLGSAQGQKSGARETEKRQAEERRADDGPCERTGRISGGEHGEANDPQADALCAGGTDEASAAEAKRLDTSPLAVFRRWLMAEPEEGDKESLREEEKTEGRGQAVANGLRLSDLKARTPPNEDARVRRKLGALREQRRARLREQSAQGLEAADEVRSPASRVALSSASGFLSSASASASFPSSLPILTSTHPSAVPSASAPSLASSTSSPPSSSSSALRSVSALPPAFSASARLSSPSGFATLASRRLYTTPAASHRRRSSSAAFLSSSAPLSSSRATEVVDGKKDVRARGPSRFDRTKTGKGVVESRRVHRLPSVKQRLGPAEGVFFLPHPVFRRGDQSGGRRGLGFGETDAKERDVTKMEEKATTEDEKGPKEEEKVELCGERSEKKRVNVSWKEDQDREVPEREHAGSVPGRVPFGIPRGEGMEAADSSGDAFASSDFLTESVCVESVDEQTGAATATQVAVYALGLDSLPWTCFLLCKRLRRFLSAVRRSGVLGIVYVPALWRGPSLLSSVHFDFNFSSFPQREKEKLRRPWDIYLAAGSCVEPVQEQLGWQARKRQRIQEAVTELRQFVWGGRGLLTSAKHALVDLSAEIERLAERLCAESDEAREGTNDEKEETEEEEEEREEEEKEELEELGEEKREAKEVEREEDGPEVGRSSQAATKGDLPFFSGGGGSWSAGAVGEREGESEKEDEKRRDTLKRRGKKAKLRRGMRVTKASGKKGNRGSSALGWNGEEENDFKAHAGETAESPQIPSSSRRGEDEAFSALRTEQAEAEDPGGSSARPGPSTHTQAGEFGRSRQGERETQEAWRHAMLEILERVILRRFTTICDKRDVLILTRFASRLRQTETPSLQEAPEAGAPGPKLVLCGPTEGSAERQFVETVLAVKAFLSGGPQGGSREPIQKSCRLLSCPPSAPKQMQRGETLVISSRPSGSVPASSPLPALTPAPTPTSVLALGNVSDLLARAAFAESTFDVLVSWISPWPSPRLSSPNVREAAAKNPLAVAVVGWVEEDVDGALAFLASGFDPSPTTGEESSGAEAPFHLLSRHRRITGVATRQAAAAKESDAKREGRVRTPPKEESTATQALDRVQSSSLLDGLSSTVVQVPRALLPLVFQASLSALREFFDDPRFDIRTTCAAILHTFGGTLLELDFSYSTHPVLSPVSFCCAPCFVSVVLESLGFFFLLASSQFDFCSLPVSPDIYHVLRGERRRDLRRVLGEARRKEQHKRGEEKDERPVALQRTGRKREVGGGERTTQTKRGRETGEEESREDDARDRRAQREALRHDQRAAVDNPLSTEESPLGSLSSSLFSSHRLIFDCEALYPPCQLAAIQSALSLFGGPFYGVKGGTVACPVTPQFPLPGDVGLVEEEAKGDAREETIEEAREAREETRGEMGEGGEREEGERGDSEADECGGARSADESATGGRLARREGGNGKSVDSGELQERRQQRREMTVVVYNPNDVPADLLLLITREGNVEDPDPVYDCLMAEASYMARTEPDVFLLSGVPFGFAPLPRYSSHPPSAVASSPDIAEHPDGKGKEDEPSERSAESPRDRRGARSEKEASGEAAREGESEVEGEIQDTTDGNPANSERTAGGSGVDTAFSETRTSPDDDPENLSSLRVRSASASAPRCNSLSASGLPRGFVCRLGAGCGAQGRACPSVHCVHERAAVRRFERLLSVMFPPGALKKEVRRNEFLVPFELGGRFIGPAGKHRKHLIARTQAFISVLNERHRGPDGRSWRRLVVGGDFAARLRIVREIFRVLQWPASEALEPCASRRGHSKVKDHAKDPDKALLDLFTLQAVPRVRMLGRDEGWAERHGEAAGEANLHTPATCMRSIPLERGVARLFRGLSERLLDVSLRLTVTRKGGKECATNCGDFHVDRGLLRVSLDRHELELVRVVSASSLRASAPDADTTRSRRQEEQGDETAEGAREGDGRAKCIVEMNAGGGTGGNEAGGEETGDLSELSPSRRCTSRLTARETYIVTIRGTLEALNGGTEGALEYLVDKTRFEDVKFSDTVQWFFFVPDVEQRGRMGASDPKREGDDQALEDSHCYFLGPRNVSGTPALGTRDAHPPVASSSYSALSPPSVWKRVEGDEAVESAWQAFVSGIDWSGRGVALLRIAGGDYLFQVATWTAFPLIRREREAGAGSEAPRRDWGAPPDAGYRLVREKGEARGELEGDEGDSGPQGSEAKEETADIEGENRLTEEVRSASRDCEDFSTNQDGPSASDEEDAKTESEARQRDEKLLSPSLPQEMHDASALALPVAAAVSTELEPSLPQGEAKDEAEPREETSAAENRGSDTARSLVSVDEEGPPAERPASISSGLPSPRLCPRVAEADSILATAASVASPSGDMRRLASSRCVPSVVATSTEATNKGSALLESSLAALLGRPEHRALRPFAFSVDCSLPPVRLTRVQIGGARGSRRGAATEDEEEEETRQEARRRDLGEAQAGDDAAAAPRGEQKTQRARGKQSTKKDARDGRELASATRGQRKSDSGESRQETRVFPEEGEPVQPCKGILRSRTRAFLRNFL